MKTTLVPSQRAALPELTQHPLAIHLMPGGMDDNEFQAFCDDVKERGILFPASLYEGKVIDGWHRYRAAQVTGRELKFIEYTGNDPAGYIAAVNVHRRKLSSLQRALVGARLHLEHGMTQRIACKKLGISNEVLSMVLKAVTTGNAVLVKRIETDTEFTRGLLREELADMGMARSKHAPDTPLAPNSVFALGAAMAADPVPEAEDLIGAAPAAPDLTVGKGLAASKAAAKKPITVDAPPHLAVLAAFRALTDAEKGAFLMAVGATLIGSQLPDAPKKQRKPR
jgi:hypothetical protein